MARKQKQDGVARDITDFAMGGASAMFATLFTNPIEVVKTRLQLQGELQKKGQHTVFYRNLPHGLFVIARTEGVRALQSGLTAMMGFQFFLNTFRCDILLYSVGWYWNNVQYEYNTTKGFKGLIPLTYCIYIAVLISKDILT